MGAIDGLKRLFGFDADYNDPEIQEDEISKPKNTPTRPGIRSNTANSTTATAAGDREPRPEDIFEHVVAVFNEALPDFLKNSVDPEKQRKLLFDSLTEDLKAYVEASRTAAEAQCRRTFEQQKTQLQANIREMEARYSQYNSMRDETQQKLLSADRQRRTLSESNKELKGRIASLEAELEQFQLENKSLVNKLKVADVRNGMQNGDNQNAEAVDTLIAAAVKSANEETEKRVRAEMEAEMKAAIEKVRAEVATTDAGDTENQLEQLRLSTDLQIEELNKRLEEAQQKADGLEKTLAMNTDMQSRQERRHNQEKEELQKLVEQLKARVEAAKEENAALTAKSKPATSEPSKEEKATQETASNEPRQFRRQSGSRRLKAPSLATNTSTPDDILSDTDWLVTPRVSGENRNDGRRKGKTLPADDQQLSLF